ncbi:hypothetical protein MXMO3_01177 [Maritalea myrionectae]|uniref:DUF2177 family protein n=1 Tax=Maritalea myrionectae TaxID=454601 RepID=A0A2R4MCE2_9HYPH|nr:DUF2177 family protein [Maritalea myrionectae]AVX03708.1 hypothetical protein MXMO3_01177 [Maritalea myrionectae]
MTNLIAYVATLVVFLGIDFVWLSYVARNFYFERISHLMADSPNFAAAGVFYLFYVVGIVYFAVLPALKAGSVMPAVISGALLGLLAYGTYDMTNYATLKDWPVSVAIVDMIWGATLTATAAAAGFYITRMVTS